MPQGFLPRIESMRGIAALTVVGFHVSNPFSAGPAFGWLDGFAFRIFTAWRELAVCAMSPVLKRESGKSRQRF
jgi:peptidoglycan/LPS O-acetylase OafA/YrhL